MTDLLHTLPNFPTKSYTHLLPSLENHLITTTDLLTLNAVDIGKRARLPVLDVRRLANHILKELKGQLGLPVAEDEFNGPADEEHDQTRCLQKSGRDLCRPLKFIQTLDDDLDETLGGGIPLGYITEIAGESGAGKTQLLLLLLLNAQLQLPNGPLCQTIYISTEHPLPTTRLSQLLSSHPRLVSLSSSLSASADESPSLSRILTLQTPDLESQEHILTYQLPVALARHDISLVVIDSIAANYRAEYAASSTNVSAATPIKNRGAALAHRSADLLRLGQLLRDLARKFDCAIVVANQVADRFGPVSSLPQRTRNENTPFPYFSSSPIPALQVPLTPTAGPRPPSSAPTLAAPTSENMMVPQSTFAGGQVRGQPEDQADTILSLDHQLRWFSGWGDTPPPPPASFLISSTPSTSSSENLKTPSLGLTWTNQIACRIVLIKEESHLFPGSQIRTQPQDQQEDQLQYPGGTAEWTPRRWRRWMRVVFAPWVEGVSDGERGVEFEIWKGGVRAISRRNQGGVR